MKRTRIKRRPPRDAESLAAFRDAVHERVWCELGPPACPAHPHEGHHAHHVIRKSQGGPNEPSNGLLTCHEGHAFVHANPALSFERGWLRRKEAS